MANAVSVAQVTALIDFIEVHPELALGRCTRSKEGRSLAKRLWAYCADTVNSITADCVQKSGEQWRVYFNDYKSKLLKKIKNEKRERSATGGGTSAEVQLTPLQDRLYTILGRDVGEPLPGVRHNPLMIEGDAAGPSSNENDIILMDSEIIALPKEEVLAEVDRQIQPVPEEIESVQEEAESVQKEKCMSKKKRIKKKQKENRSKASQELEREPTMREAAATLERMERINADAMLVHASAISRLAAAVELVAERLPAPVAAMPGSSPARSRSRSRSRRRRRVIISSDSE